MLYAWHGTMVPEDWIERRDAVDPRLAITHDNVEQRRALAEIVGWDRVLKQLSAKRIHRDRWGELLEVELPDSGLTRFVQVVCTTGRTFAIPVPREMKTALAAVAWTYQQTPEEYQNLEVRT